MANTNAISFERESYINQTKERYTKKELDKNAFLSLLVAQMKYQDPSKPMEDTAFVAQLAQFSSLEQMGNMTNSFSQMQATSLIGKTILAEVSIDVGNGVMARREVAGIVTSAGIKDGDPYVLVDDVMVKVSEISQVFDTDAVFLNYKDVLEGATVVGKYVMAEYAGEDGSIIKVGGVVEKLVVEKGEIQIKVGEHIFRVSDVLEIANSGEDITEITPPDGDGKNNISVGKYVLAEYEGMDGSLVKVGGIVEKLFLEDGDMKIKIGDHIFRVSDVLNTADSGENIEEITPPKASETDENV